jgi:hypothetical protein
MLLPILKALPFVRTRAFPYRLFSLTIRTQVATRVLHVTGIDTDRRHYFLQEQNGISHAGSL